MNTAAAAQPVGPAARPPIASAVASSMAAVPLTTPIFRSTSGASMSAATCASCEPDMIRPDALHRRMQVREERVKNGLNAPVARFQMAHTIRNRTTNRLRG
jgi:hypothetical protein